MQSLLTLTVVVFAAVTGSPSDGNECDAEYFTAGECCSLNAFQSSLKTNTKTHIESCMQKQVGETAHKTPFEALDAYTCKTECIFSLEGLLTADNKLDKVALTKYFTPHDADVVPVVMSAYEQCMGSYEADVDPRLKCKSGALQFFICFRKHVFLNCPRSHWSGSSECDEIKAKSIKCPQVQLRIKKF